MKRIVASRTARYIVFCLQCLFLLAGAPLTSAAQGVPGQMELRSMRPADAVSRNMPGMGCRSFAFCCLAPPVPVRVSGSSERLEPEKVITEYLLDADRDTFAVALRMASSPTVALRVMYCCWRN